jgi:hypothetical protein
MKIGESFVTVMGSVSGFMWVVMRMEEAWPDLCCVVKTREE